MKALTRVPIFSYSTIATTLLMPTKSLEVKFRKKFLNAETLFELESLLAWTKAHTEIQSLFITSVGDEFIQGFDPLELRELSEEKISKLFQKIAMINHSLLCLPQTVVVDMKKGTRGVGLEFCLAADIRLAKNDAVFCFNQLSQGLTLSSGAFSFLRSHLNQNVLRSLLLSGVEFNKESFIALGGWCEFEQEANTILTLIFNQAPIARIQAKLGLYGLHQESNDREIEKEKSLFNAVLKSQDYTKENNFMTAAEYKDQTAELRN